MKEIDFLPEWYKSGKRRQVSYRTQYVAISSVFVVMMAWSFIATRSISKARAQISQMATQQAQAKMVSDEHTGLEDEIRVLRKKAESIEEIDSKIDVASVLAEMSFLIDERIVLRKLEFIAEKFVNEQDTKKSPGVGTVVRVVQSSMRNKKELPLGNVRFKVVIAGIAADTNDVAALMCKLEDSPYFCQVILSYSRGSDEIGIKNASSFRTGTNVVQGVEKNRNLVRDAGAQGKIQVNEFEINCYLANYRQL
ncbi:MAG: PilN domain-containing protein [Candidatus Hodarchaeota archaeon]